MFCKVRNWRGIFLTTEYTETPSASRNVRFRVGEKKLFVRGFICLDDFVCERRAFFAVCQSKRNLERVNEKLVGC